MFSTNIELLMQKMKKNPEPELFSGGLGVAGADTYTGLFGKQKKKMIFLETN